MDANETFDTFMRELNNRVTCDTDGADEDPDDDVPHSLLRYLETSRSRAAVCEKLILEELGDFPASHPTEDTMNFPFEVDEDTRRPNEQVVCDTEDEENNTSSDARLLPAPTETEALFTHNVSVCSNNEDEDEAQRQKQRCDEMKEEEEELKRQIERDFQTQLKKMMEAEKLQQKELELMGRRAQEKLDQELLLQQELMRDLQRRVQEERRMREEEQKRMKDEEDKRTREEEQKRMKNEEDKRTREEEKIKLEAEEMRRKKEEERRMEEMELKKEEERKREQEEKRRVEWEEKRKREEEKTKIEMEKRKLEEDMIIIKEEEEREKKEEEEEKRKREEERKEEAKKKMEKEKRKMEDDISQKKEEERKIEEMALKKEEERKREHEEKRRVEREEKRKREEEQNKLEMEKRKLEEEMRMMKEEEEREKKEEEEERKREEERKNIEEEAKKKVEKEKRKMEEDISQKKEERKKREEENRKIEEEVRITKEIEERKKQEEARKNKEKEEEEALKKFHAAMKKRDEKEQSPLLELRKEEEEDRNTKEEPRPIEKDEKRKREEERKTKEEERMRRTREDLRQEDEEGHRKAEAEIKLKEDEEGYKRYEVDNRKMEHESKTKEEEEEEEVEVEEEEENVEGEKELKEEEAGGNKKEVNRKSEEEITLKEKEERKKRVVHDREREGRGANEPKEKIENNRTSSSTEVKPQQHDPHVKVGPTSTDGAAGPDPESTEKRRLAWMKDCVPWSKLSLQNRSKPRGSARSRRRSAGSGGPAPLCPDALLRSTGCTSLQEVTSVTLEDLPGRGSSTLALCTRLRSLTLRRCGLRSLEGINQLPQLCHIDVQENDISVVDCENMSSLRVLRLGRNKLTSIHGLTGAERLDVLDLSHNSITRIAGLESMRRLQRLSVDHNQLISTRGLRDVYTLLHLSCSHNHLASVEGLENSALLNTLDLSANSLAEPPSLSNQVLLRELHLDDNNISSLQGLTACWLPLMQHLSVAQNRITQLPPMSGSVSLANLDLRFNCMSELQNVCESLEGCVFLREVHLSGNPLQQERGWRAALQRAAPGLRAVDGRQTDSAPTPPAAGRVGPAGPASGSFLAFCQAQLRQTLDLQRRHDRELSGASSSLDAVTISCRHHAEVLLLAMDHRFAHEHGDATVAAGRGTPGEMDGDNAERPETESAGKVPPGSSCLTPEESRRGAFDPVGPKTGPTVSEAASGSVRSSSTKRKTTSSNLEVAPVSCHQHLDLQKTAAAVVIQQLWRKYRQKCGNISSLSAADKGGGRGGRDGGRDGGDGGKPESEPTYVNGSVVGPDYAATVIQAFWRGFALRRRLASTPAAVSRPDAGEDDDDAFEFEEVDVDEFVFDEKRWTLAFSEDSPPRRCPASEPSLKHPEPSQYILPPPPVWRTKQAWLPGGQVDSAGQTGSPETSNSAFNDFRSKSPASSSVPSGLSQRSEKILEEWGFTDSHTALLMLKRAQKMKPTTQRQKKRRDPSFRPAFRNCSYPLAPVEARNRPAQHNRSDMNGGEAEPGLRHAERAERVKRLRTRAAHPDSDSKSVHFLPEISSDVLNGGRVQLVADPAYTARPTHAGGSGTSERSAARPGREHDHPRRNSYGPSSGEVPSPRRVASAPSKRERISHRDNAVQLSGGWGGGKKRDKEYK